MVARKAGTHAELVEITAWMPRSGPPVPKGACPMMCSLSLAAIPVLAIVTPAVVYLVSKDPDRRSRAWQLLKLLLRR